MRCANSIIHFNVNHLKFEMVFKIMWAVVAVLQMHCNASHRSMLYSELFALTVIEIQRNEKLVEKKEWKKWLFLVLKRTQDHKSTAKNSNTTATQQWVALFWPNACCEFQVEKYMQYRIKISNNTQRNAIYSKDRRRARTLSLSTFVSATLFLLLCQKGWCSSREMSAISPFTSKMGKDILWFARRLCDCTSSNKCTYPQMYARIDVVSFLLYTMVAAATVYSELKD